MPLLDHKDRKLLYELDRNSRQTVQQLARNIGLSKDAVKYRINKLFAEGIIKTFTAVIDTGKLGFYSFRIFLKLYQTSPQKEQEIIHFLLQNKNLLWLVQVEGNWDINTWFLYSTVDEMNRFWEELLSRFNNHIAKREFGIYTAATYFGRVYLMGEKQNTFSIPVVSLPNRADIDASELKILELLSNNARLTIVELARATQLTAKTIIQKLKRLEAEKVIVGYRAEFDLEKLGYRYYKIHIDTCNMTTEKLRQVKQYIFQHPSIVFEDVVLGGYDIEIEVQVKDESALRDIIKDIRQHFSSVIKDYDVLHYFREYRLRFFPSRAQTINLINVT